MTRNRVCLHIYELLLWLVQQDKMNLGSLDWTRIELGEIMCDHVKYKQGNPETHWFKLIHQE